MSLKVCGNTNIIANHFEPYTPDNISIQLGDTVWFQLDSFHNALEVNHGVWDSSFAVSNGGFYTPFGGGIWIPDTGGIYYYVCELHAHDGMKGRIFVTDPNGISVLNEYYAKLFSLFPQPAPDLINVSLTIQLQSGTLNILLKDAGGKAIRVITAKRSPEISIHINQLSSGAYFMSISDGKKSYTQKFIKI
ncbi:MAG: T9SS type A sorting domain-containing protein [Chitinophagales bacterium]